MDRTNHLKYKAFLFAFFLILTSFVTSKEILKYNEEDLKKLKECEDFCKKIQAVDVFQFILINVSKQKLHLFEKDKYILSYSISTGIKGVGQEIGSNKTPLGFHIICEKIGWGADPWDIFYARKNTNIKATVNYGLDYIIARILRLQGLQEKYNKGYSDENILVDSYRRFIYIHGTNLIANIGKPFSTGCIRLTPIDMIDLFNRVNEDALVYIYVEGD